MKKLDLTDCEKEPVRYIGAIQSFGAMVVLNESYEIVLASQNLKDITGIDSKSVMGKEFGELPVDESQFHVTSLYNGKHHIVEIEPRKAEEEISFDLNEKINSFQNENSLIPMLQKSAEAMAIVTGLDRVMIYKFHEDLHGEVVAEAKRPGIDSFLGLHYPASDVPPQAREIFKESWVRIIPDVNSNAVPLEGKADTGSFDMGKSLLRAASPIHIEYLKNMKIKASLTVSIIVEGKLWGLFACHHNSPKYVPKKIRSLCETLARMTSSLIRETEIREIYDETQKIKASAAGLQKRLLNAVDIGEELTKNHPNLVELVQAESAAAALYIEGYWAKVGKTPEEKDLDELVGWLSQYMTEDVFSTHALSAIYPEARKYTKEASGLLAARIPKTKNSFILWFRPEVIQTVRWGGNPDKVVSVVNGRLTPRASFEEWKSSVEGQSIPWKPWEITAAYEIRNAVISNDLNRQFEKEKVARAEVQLEKESREELMSIVSHDLKNPLSSIHVNAQLLKRFIRPDNDKALGVVDRIYKSTTAMNNLIEDILSVTKLEAGHIELELTTANLMEIVLDSFDILQPLANDKGILLTIDPTSIECDVQVDKGRMLQVLSNIIGNALKFTPEKGTISIKLEKCGPEFAQVRIKDSGSGIPKDHLPHVFDRFWQAKEAKRLGTGLGLAIVKGIIEKHGGEIWAESEMGKGTSFIFKIPLGMK